ncbi:MAG: sugar nucleotide-binding protein [Clostridia bacterium]|nr:sugar nucleotide-binding protein [Clostridia bacterium]
MKVLVTGARGLLGRAVAAELENRNWPAVALGRAELDITDLAAVRQALVQHRPEVVVNCAAYTRVDQAEAEYEAALKVNALGVKNLALACAEKDTALVHLSTDYKKYLFGLGVAPLIA